MPHMNVAGVKRRVSAHDLNEMKVDARALGRAFGRVRWSWLCFEHIVVHTPPERVVYLTTVESPEAVDAARRDGVLLEELAPPSIQSAVR